ncbi:hypothetical protein [Chryseobacterium sp. MP_3.2]|uniref:hypothetical protein n=1 Tax=Chryseobacterium sp. MP_3.2 TaxID=3071712 RepID=UPI002DFBF022|nr:hypothetical protein [Chryseobacterium sp. MP_3.2]
MENIYNAIKNDVRNHPNVKLSILGQVFDWKRSQYVILSEIISEYLSNSTVLTDVRKLNLGSTISPVTLQRFFNDEYHIKTHNDLRFIKTLDKICIFLGKFDLNNYIQDWINQGKNTGAKNALDLNFFEKDLVINCCRFHFEAFCDLPAVNIEKISDFVFHDSPLQERIKSSMEEKRMKNLIFISENNKSNYEIFELYKICDDPDLKVIKTQEFWNLLFMDEKRIEYVINHVNTQFYILKKRDGEWKIWDNYNPEQGKILKIN